MWKHTLIAVSAAALLAGATSLLASAGPGTTMGPRAASIESQPLLIAKKKDKGTKVVIKIDGKKVDVFWLEPGQTFDVTVYAAPIT